VSEVVAELVARATAVGLIAALDATSDFPNAQRLGALLALNGSTLADAIAAWLDDRSLRTILLVSGTSGALKKDEIFRVLRPAHLQVSNT
jgi:hypothetical protein